MIQRTTSKASSPIITESRSPRARTMNLSARSNAFQHLHCLDCVESCFILETIASVVAMVIGCWQEDGETLIIVAADFRFANF